MELGGLAPSSVSSSCRREGSRPLPIIFSASDCLVGCDEPRATATGPVVMELPLWRVVLRTVKPGEPYKWAASTLHEVVEEYKCGNFLKATVKILPGVACVLLTVAGNFYRACLNFWKDVANRHQVWWGQYKKNKTSHSDKSREREILPRVGWLQAKLVRAVICAALKKRTMGLSFPAQTGLCSCSRLWESRNVTICVLLHLKKKIKKNLECQPSADIASKLYPGIWGQRRKGSAFLREEALFKEKEQPVPGVLLDPETWEEHVQDGLASQSNHFL